MCFRASGRLVEAPFPSSLGPQIFIELFLYKLCTLHTETEVRPSFLLSLVVSSLFWDFLYTSVGVGRLGKQFKIRKGVPVAPVWSPTISAYYPDFISFHSHFIFANFPLERLTTFSVKLIDQTKFSSSSCTSTYCFNFLPVAFTTPHIKNKDTNKMQNFLSLSLV